MNETSSILDSTGKSTMPPPKVAPKISKSPASQEADALIKDQVNKVVQKKATKPDLPGMGDNSGEASEDFHGIAGKRLLSFFERIERLEEEKSALAEDIKEVKAEAKSAGFEVKIMTKILKLRKMDPDARSEEDELTNLYLSAIGMS